MFLKTFFGEVGNPHPCASCQGDDLLDFDVRMAFQPTVPRAVFLPTRRWCAAWTARGRVK